MALARCSGNGVPEAAQCNAGTETPQDIIATEEDSADLLMTNDTLTEAVLVVFHVADGSLLGSGFSASYSGLDQGAPNALSPLFVSFQGPWAGMIPGLCLKSRQWEAPASKQAQQPVLSRHLLRNSLFRLTLAWVHAVTGARAADCGFSKGAAAGIIIGAIIFGLLAGVATGFAVIRCYTIYTTINSGEARMLWRSAFVLQHVQG